MKGLLLFVCAVIANVHSQNCGCSNSSQQCRPIPRCPRPSLPPCQRPIPSCPRPCPPPCPCSLPPCQCSAPIIEYCDYNLPVVSSLYQTPIVSYDSCTSVALPTCNCPSPPSLPVYPQLPQAYASLLGALPFLNGLGLLSPCLGGCGDLGISALSGLSPLSPLGMINPFLPAASPVSAIAPTVSSLYPPINPCGCGCNYLKKIPLPPPFI